VRPEHVIAAITAARDGAVDEGSVGAGTGTRAFAWKGGIGTASRRLEARAGGYTVGVLVQTNYGGSLTMGGAPVGRELQAVRAGAPEDHDGSCMIVVATDAPIDARDLTRLAARAIYGLARTGSSYSNGSGDFAIAFSTASDLRVTFGDATPRARTLLPTDGVSGLFLAALEATEEAVYNSLPSRDPQSFGIGRYCAGESRGANRPPRRRMAARDATKRHALWFGVQHLVMPTVHHTPRALHPACEPCPCGDDCGTYCTDRSQSRRVGNPDGDRRHIGHSLPEMTHCKVRTGWVAQLSAVLSSG
jgi:hypothetical protein